MNAVHSKDPDAVKLWLNTVAVFVKLFIKQDTIISSRDTTRQMFRLTSIPLFRTHQGIPFPLKWNVCHA